MSSLEDRLHALQVAEGWSRPLTISEMVEGWRDFIAQCEESYEWGIYEYENDLSIRDRIESVLHADGLGESRVLQSMMEQVSLLDRRFRALLMQSPGGETEESSWWRRGVLRYAGETYAADVASLKGVEIEVRP